MISTKVLPSLNNKLCADISVIIFYTTIIIFCVFSLYYHNSHIAFHQCHLQKSPRKRGPIFFPPSLSRYQPVIMSCRRDGPHAIEGAPGHPIHCFGGPPRFICRGQRLAARSVPFPAFFFHSFRTTKKKERKRISFFTRVEINF